MKRKIGITIGEPFGIGPEITLRGLANLHPSEEIILYGPRDLITKTAEKFGVASLLDERTLKIESTSDSPKHIDDRMGRAHATISMIDRAIEDAQAGLVQALITGPIDKSIVRTKLPSFTGHTGYLEKKSNVKKTLMMLDNTEIRVLLLTDHIPLREVHCAVGTLEIVSSIELAILSLQKHFGIQKPKIAIVGLNPHAGETVDDAEEKTLITPAVNILQKKGLNVQGPFAADSFFAIARKGGWDLIVSLYHDQGLIAAKYPGLDKVVNITLGLPYLRVSPGHGTAYDLVGKGTADPRSFERAYRIASEGKLVV